MAEQDQFKMMEILTEEEQQELLRVKKAKKKNYIVGLSLTGVFAIALIIVYALAANVWLIDYQNMSYITFSYPALVEDGEEATATIISVDRNSNYPSEFRIPGKLNGYRVTAIGDSAFAGCDRLTKVIMTDNITSIGSYAFAAATNLKTIEFSKNIELLGTNAFQNTHFLDNLPTDEVSAIHGILFHVGTDVVSDKTVILENHQSIIPDKYKNNYNVIYMDDWVAEGDSEIKVWSDGLFAGMDGLVYCELPQIDTFKTVPIDTFKDCENLEGISFPDTITKVDDNAFYGCSSLEDLDISSAIENIGSYAFANSGVKDPILPETLKTIAAGAFSGSNNIEAVVWPDNLTTISASTFENCENLASFTISDYAYENIVTIGMSAFKNTGLTTFDVPKNVSTIFETTFSDSKNLKEVRVYEGNISYDRHGDEIRTGITKINRGAFNNCTSFDSLILVDENRLDKTPVGEVHLPSTLSLFSGDMGIFGNAAVKKVTIPHTASSIGYMMFANNTALEEIHIETKRVGVDISGIKKIEYRSFYNCTSLTDFVVPETVTTIEQGAFENCEGIVAMTLPQGIDSGLKVIRSDTFKNLQNLAHLDLSPNINKIESDAFYNNTSLDYIVIKLDDAKNLGLNYRAFNKCRAPEDTTKMPIFLSVLENDVSKTKVIDGWYDPETSVPYWANEWSYVGGVPTPSVIK